MRGLEVPGELLVDVPSDWQEIRLKTVRGPGATAEWQGQDGHVTLPLASGGQVLLDRDARTATFVTPTGLSDGELVHPYLGAAAGHGFAYWLFRRRAFHAGAFVVDGAAWGVVGVKEAGKSTLLAALHMAGIPVLTDDVLVVEGHRAFAGPRCLDLREPTVSNLAAGTTSPSRGGDRRRLVLPQIEAEVPLAGWIVLGWGDDIDLAPVPLPERLGVLNRHRMYQFDEQDPVGALDAAALPTWALRRPPSWGAVHATVNRLLELTGG